MRKDRSNSEFAGEFSKVGSAITDPNSEFVEGHRPIRDPNSAANLPNIGQRPTVADSLPPPHQPSDVDLRIMAVEYACQIPRVPNATATSEMLKHARTIFEYLKSGELGE